MAKKSKFTLKDKYVHEEVCAKGQFDRRSFRRKRVNKNTMLTVGCPTGEYSPKQRKCKVGTRVQNKLVEAKAFERKHPTLMKKLKRRRGKAIRGKGTMPKRCPK